MQFLWQNSNIIRKRKILDLNECRTFSNWTFSPWYIPFFGSRCFIFIR